MRGRAAAALVAAAIGMSAGVAEAAIPPPAPGEYEAVPLVDSGTTYEIGGFAVVRSGGKRRIVGSGRYGGIFYPDVGACDDESLPLAAESIPISASSRFKHHERTPAEGGAVEVTWKGHWTKARRVRGTIRIERGGCASTEEWSGRKVG